MLEYSDYYFETAKRAIEGSVLLSNKTLVSISKSIREDFDLSVGPKTVKRIAKGHLSDEKYQERFNSEGIEFAFPTQTIELMK